MNQGFRKIGLLPKKSEGLKRGLKMRQVQLLSIGGVIGVGLFYGSGVAIKLAGPAVLLDYVIGGILVAIVMRALGEMSVADPRAGSFSLYARRELGPYWGYVTGGMWWFFWVTTVMSELSAIGLLVQYWFPSFPAWIPGAIALGLFAFSNLWTVKVFGELEFWFAVLKIFAIAVFMLLGLSMVFFGFFHHGVPLGISNLNSGKGFMPYGLLGVAQAFSLVVLGYSGVETLAVTAGETEDPGTALPRAVNSVTWRIAILYIGSILVMLLAFPWMNLLGHQVSPYVLLFKRVGLPLTATLINLIIISSGLSSSNTGLYGGSRMLFSLSQQGEMPKVFGKLNSKKVPAISVVVTALAMSLGVALTAIAPNSVYVWISSAASFGALWTWAMILVSEIRFRYRTKEKMDFPMPWWPVLSIVGLLILVTIFIAIATSPLTSVSVWSGFAWLVVLTIYWYIRPKRLSSEKTSS